jgi:hypothetical protein
MVHAEWKSQTRKNALLQACGEGMLYFLSRPRWRDFDLFRLMRDGTMGSDSGIRTTLEVVLSQNVVGVVFE